MQDNAQAHDVREDTGWKLRHGLGGGFGFGETTETLQREGDVAVWQGTVWLKPFRLRVAVERALVVRVRSE
jgi:hypothetical protein